MDLQYMVQSVYNSTKAAESVGEFLFAAPFLLCMCLLSVFILAIFIYLIIDLLQRDFGNDSNGFVLGIVLVLLVGFPIGYIIYYFVIMQRYPKRSNANLANTKAKS